MSPNKLNPARPLWQVLLGLGGVAAFLAYMWAQLPPLATGWSWQPYAAEVDYSTGGSPVRTLRLVGNEIDGTAVIEFTPGEPVRLHAVRYALFPSCSRLGVRILQYEDTAGLTPPDSHPRIRLRADVRKHWGEKPRDEWYDEGGLRCTPWLEIGTQLREAAWSADWVPEKDWDVLRIRVEVEGRGMAEGSEAPIGLRPADGGAQWDVRHNIFNTLLVEVGVGRVMLLALGAAVLLALALGRRQHVRGLGP